jgi:hypothetical protein
MRSVAVFVTRDAESNQVVRHIATELAPPFHVMDLQVVHGTAVLTAPTVPFENVSSKEGVVFGIQSEPVVPLAAWRRVR